MRAHQSWYYTDTLISGGHAVILLLLLTFMFPRRGKLFAPQYNSDERAGKLAVVGGDVENLLLWKENAETPRGTHYSVFFSRSLDLEALGALG